MQRAQWGAIEVGTRPPTPKRAGVVGRRNGVQKEFKQKPQAQRTEVVKKVSQEKGPNGGKRKCKRGGGVAQGVTGIQRGIGHGDRKEERSGGCNLGCTPESREKKAGEQY